MLSLFLKIFKLILLVKKIEMQSTRVKIHSLGFLWWSSGCVSPASHAGPGCDPDQELDPPAEARNSQAATEDRGKCRGEDGRSRVLQLESRAAR